MIETDKERLCYNCVHSSPDCSFCGKTKQNITPRSRCDPSHSKAFDLIDNACSFEEWKKKEKQKQNFANGKFEIDEEYSLQIIDHRIIELKRNKSVINRFEFDHLDIVLLNKISSVITDLNLVENRKEAKKLLRDVIFKHFNDYRVMLLSELGDIKKKCC